MSIRRVHNLPILCLLLLCLLTSPVSTFGYVWCVSADGRATLEEAMVGDCGLDTPAAPADSAATSSLTIDADDCGPCLDVSPSHQWGSPRTRQNETSVGVPAEFVPVTVKTYALFPDQLQTGHFAVSPSPRTPDPILHHRTIVLLI
ncbi:MAG: hypothetical protein FIB02_04180 [Desulfuromonas sp.]|nr:hypothetical protein [Desulfuromonas sp.]